MHKISIVIPTRNEEGNIIQLLSHFNFASKDLDYEPLIVDDSTDNTAEVARRSGAKVLMGQNKGLGQAIIDGIEASRGDIVVVMDADLSHNPHSVPDLIKPLLEQGCDMTIGSRYVAGGKSVGWSLKRRIVSRLACLLALPVTQVKDATSGFFAFKKPILDNVDLKPSSWKIMLEVLIKTNPTKIKEVPIIFEERHAGESKFDKQQVIAYIKHLLLLLFYKYRWLRFGLVGGSGVIIHFVFLYGFTEFIGLWYILSAIISIIIASTSNYILNNLWTFVEHKNVGPRSHFIGWVKYQGISAITDALYLGLLALFVEVVGLWYILGAALSMVAVFIIKFKVAKRWIWTPAKSKERTVA